MQATDKSKTRQNVCSLRLLSYNIQGGIETRAYHHYFLKGWQHLLPHRQKQENLDKVANLICEYDIVALQEADAGSLRTNFMNQTEYLAKKAHFPFWFDQVNRNIGRFAQHSNGLLCKANPISVSDHRLPGIIPGRGILLARFRIAKQELLVIVAHLALGKKTRMQQLKYISDLIKSEEHVILMGDLNCELDSKEMKYFFSQSKMREPEKSHDTFPSWKPKRHIDHILVSRDVKITEVEVLAKGGSDHLPVAVNIELNNKRVKH